jgi:small multidrug resistance family-3 protein
MAQGGICSPVNRELLLDAKHDAALVEKNFRKRTKELSGDPMTLRIFFLLVLAAALEVGGDALIRAGLGRRAGWLLLAGGATLVVYGLMVNLTSLDFSRLMGIYIVIFFLVAQATAILFFHETPGRPVLAGGALVVLGGVVMTVLR